MMHYSLLLLAIGCGVRTLEKIELVSLETGCLHLTEAALSEVHTLCRDAPRDWETVYRVREVLKTLKEDCDKSG